MKRFVRLLKAEGDGSEVIYYLPVDRILRLVENSGKFGVIAYEPMTYANPGKEKPKMHRISAEDFEMLVESEMSALPQIPLGEGRGRLWQAGNGDDE